MYKRQLLVNKIDSLPMFDFDMDAVRQRALQRNPDIQVFPLSAKTGEGMDAWYQWLDNEIRAWKNL